MRNALQGEEFGGVRVSVLGSQPVAGNQTLWFVRLTFAPRTSLPYRTNPGANAVHVETGVIGFTYVAGAARITPPGGDAGTSAPWLVNAEAILAPGTTVTFGPDTMHLIRNAGDEPAQILLSMIGPTDRPPFARAFTTHGKPVEQG